MLRQVFLLVAILGVGCSKGTVHPEFVGEFEVVTRDGRPLPAPLPSSIGREPCVHDLLFGRLTIRSNGTWTETLAYRHRCGVDGADVRDPKTNEHSGTTNAHEKPHRISFTSAEMKDSGIRQEAVLKGSELFMTVTNEINGGVIPFTYRRTR